MKTNIWKIAVAALAATSLLVSCNKSSGTATSAKVSLTADSAFEDGSATLTLTLSAAATSDVSVTLAASGDCVSALSWNPVATIPAGTSTKTVEITVDDSDLDAGTYNTTFSIKSATGAAVGSPSEAVVKLTVEEEEVVPVVTIASFDDAFTDGAASLTLALSDAASVDVAVTLELASEYGEYSVVPASALSFTNPVTIAAGKTSAVVDLTLDTSALPTGSSWAVISIKSAENATVGKKATAYIEAVVEAEVERVSSWTIAYAGREAATSGTVYDWISVSGWSGEYFDLAVFVEGTLASVENDVTAVMEYRHQKYVGTYFGEYTLDDLLFNENGDCAFQLLDPGKYEVFVFDYTSAGVMTGKWNMATIEISEGEASDAYNAVLGTYSVAASNATWEDDNNETQTGNFTYDKVTIEHNVNNSSFVVYFWYDSEGEEYAYPAILDFDASTGGLAFNTHHIYDWEHSTYGPIEDWQYAYILHSGDLIPVTGSYEIANSTGLASGKIEFNAGDPIRLQDGSTVDLIGLRLIGEIMEGEYAGYYFRYLDVPMPSTFTRTGDLPETSTSAIAPKGVRRASVVAKEARIFRTPFLNGIAL